MNECMEVGKEVPVPFVRRGPQRKLGKKNQTKPNIRILMKVIICFSEGRGMVKKVAALGYMWLAT